MGLTGFIALMEKLVFNGFLHKENIIGCKNAFLIKQMKVLKLHISEEYAEINGKNLIFSKMD